ncbi:major strawberry allergen Fra a 1.08-like [Benincasa hispida]|uniref:major strawberry allergen Fra a 1.08-like n=1 Tax=Benincasa hispida TaxID=102211 RepID=UPI0019006D4C|nr:major strawberry allergen Fra a 1.08-like [Benincasa hispida]
MRSMKGEVLLKLPAEKAWEMYRDNDVVSKINPELLSRAEYVQGDGGPGTLRLFKLGPAVRSYVEESVEKIEKVETGRSVSYDVVGGELRKMYNPYKVTFTFTPVEGKEKEMCIAQWEAEYEPITPAIPPPDKARDAALQFLQCFDKFQLSY